MKIAVFDDWNGFAARSPHAERLRALGELTVFDDFPSRDEVRRRLAEFDAVVLWRDRTRITSEVLPDGGRLRVIAQTGNSWAHLDLDELERRGVTAIVPPFLFAEGHPTADFTMGLILDLAHEISFSDRRMRHTRWPAVVARGVRGRTLGLVGYGRMGQTLARQAAAFGMEVVAWGRSLTPGERLDSGALALDLDEVLGRSEFLSVQLRLSDETRGFLGARELALLPPGALLVNTARAAIVDQDAMLAMLRDGRLGGAALDVFDQEPLPEDHPLRTLDNVVLTPHIGWTQEPGLDRLLGQAVDHLSEWAAQQAGTAR